MSFVRTLPEHLTAAASTLQSLGAAMNVGSAAAAGPITGVIPAAIDRCRSLLPHSSPRTASGSRN
jgi:hypothetical protein